jgi:general stress protein YciG
MSFLLVLGCPAMEDGSKRKRGFAQLSPERHREISSQGGRAAQGTGNAHRFNSEEAREAGRLGGLAARKKRAEPADA